MANYQMLGVTASAVSSFAASGSCYALLVKVSEVLRMLQTDGWTLAAQRGSHRQFKHQSKVGRVTVPGKPAMILHPEPTTAS